MCNKTETTARTPTIGKGHPGTKKKLLSGHNGQHNIGNKLFYNDLASNETQDKCEEGFI